MNGIEIAKKVVSEKFALVVNGTDITPIDPASDLGSKFIRDALMPDMPTDEVEIERRLTSLRSGGFGSPEARVAKLSDEFLSGMQKRFAAEPQPWKAPSRFFR